MKQGDATASYVLINEVSKRVGLSQKRIRDYEKRGLIKPCRDPRTNNRLYSEMDIRQINRIKDLIHKHGFTLACIQQFLASAPCWQIYDCQKKKQCPAYGASETPCFETAMAAGYTPPSKCERCPIYMNRNITPIPIFTNH